MRSIIFKLGACLLWIIFFNIIFCVNISMAANARIKEIQAIKRYESIVVYATLDGAFTRDIVEAICSGAPTRFRFLIHLMKKRGLWLDKKVKEFTVNHTVIYDVLKKEYLATRSYPEGLEESLKTSDWDAMAQWMSELKAIRLNTHEMEIQKERHYLSVRAEMKCIKIPFPLNYLLAFISLWNFDTPWVKVPLEEEPKKSDIIEQALIPNGNQP